MPDFSDTKAINDTNKALQDNIKAKSNKEAPFTVTERRFMAGLFTETPDADIWDIAERFNHIAHPLTGPEGQYPKGRFTESICHEYRMYKTSYDSGEAPTDETDKDIQLEKLWAAEKATLKKGKKASVKSTKDFQTRDTARVTKKPRAAGKSNKLKFKHLSKPVFFAKPMSEQPRLSDDDEKLLEAAGAYDAEDYMSPYTQAVVISSGYAYGSPAAEQDERAVVAQTPNGTHDTNTVKSPSRIVVPSSASIQMQASNGVNSTHVVPKASGHVPAPQQHIASDAQRLQSMNTTDILPQLQVQTRGAQTVVRTGITGQEIQAEMGIAILDGVVAESPGTVATPASTFELRAVRRIQVDESYDDDDGDGDGLEDLVR